MKTFCGLKLPMKQEFIPTILCKSAKCDNDCDKCILAPINVEAFEKWVRDYQHSSARNY